MSLEISVISHHHRQERKQLSHHCPPPDGLSSIAQTEMVMLYYHSVLEVRG
jgi:hypothetical protein